MARTMEQVLADVSKQSDPQRQLILKQVSDLPTLQQADESGLESQKNKGFNDIVLGARRRGVAYWGAPIAEQQDYLSTQYLPAVAKMKQGYNDRRTSLESALNDIGRNDYSTAYSMYNTDRQFEEQQRQFNEQMAEQRQAAGRASAQQASADSYLRQQNSQGATAGAGGGATIAKRDNGGFNFTNAYGNPISAAQYAATKNIPFRDLLGIMAREGDKGAATVLGFAGNDFGYDSRKIGNNANLYNSFVWGTGKSYKAPKSGGGGGW